MSDLAPTEIPEHLQAGIGDRIRTARTAQGLSARAFARSLGVSPSLISQIELGKALPSVGTLFAIVTKLSISLDEIFFDAAGEPAPAGGATAARPAEEHGAQPPGGIVQRREQRRSIMLASGVRWERLTPDHDYEVDFLQVTYDVGAESCPTEALMTHSGREYGLVEAGRLGATIGFESFELEAGDSIAFDARVPHRFWTIGQRPAVVTWLIAGRGADPRFAHARGTV